MAKAFDPRRLDLRRFAEEAGRLDVEEPLSGYGRLFAETQHQHGDRLVHWRAHGELQQADRPQPQVWMHLEAEALLPLVCQRCLLPVEVAVAVDRRFRFAPDEETAASEDDASEEEVLALSRQFDLVELVEDELLMDLPVAPRHEACPEPVKMSAADPAFHLAEATRENPFSVLGRLKTSKR